MFAQVYLATRTPRRFDVFDYRVPDNLTAHVGDIVTVSFKGRTLLGVISALSETTEVKRTKPLLSIVASQFFTHADLERITTLAQHTIQSPCTLFGVLLKGWRPTSKPLPTRQAPSISLPSTFSELLQQLPPVLADHDDTFIQTTFAGALATVYKAAQTYKDQIFVLVPRERDAELLAQSFPAPSVASLHGTSPVTHKRAVMNAWQRGDLRILIATRIGTLLPAKKLSAVITTDCMSEDYEFQKRNPRFDARHAAQLLAQQHKAKRIDIGHSKPLHTYPHDLLTSSTAQVVDVGHKTQQTGVPFLSTDLIERMKDVRANGDRVLLVYNRKGIAQRLQCQSCGHIPFCATCGALPTIRQNDLHCLTCGAEMWIPKTCPSCRSNKLKTRGLGNKTIAKHLKQLFPQSSITIIDKGTDATTHADITLATNYLFTSVLSPLKDSYQLVADLCADLSTDHTINGQQHLKEKLHRLDLLAQQWQALCFLQTWSPELITSILDDSFYARELEQRKTYHLPPFTTQLRFTVKDEAGMQALQQLQRAYPSETWNTHEKGLELLTKRPISDTLSFQLKQLPDSVIIEVL